VVSTENLYQFPEANTELLTCPIAFCVKNIVNKNKKNLFINSIQITQNNKSYFNRYKDKLY
jgi:hypothetical protein